MVFEDPGPSVPRPKRRMHQVPDAIGAGSKKRKGNGHTRGGDYSSRTGGLDSSGSVETINGRKGRGCLYCSVSLQDLDPSVPILPELGNDSTCAHVRYAVVTCGRRDMTFTRLLGATAGSCWMRWPMIQLPDDPVTKSKRFHRSKFVDPPPRAARCIQANDARRVLCKAVEPVGSPVLKVHLKTKMMSADPKEPRSHGSLPILLGLVKLIDVTKEQQEKIMRNNPLVYECFQQSDVIERSQQHQDEKVLVLQEDENIRNLHSSAMTKTSNLESFLAANKSFREKFGDNGSLPAPPSRKTFILTCIDARLVPYDALGLEIGECHIFRNAGGRVSDDAIRSFVMTQQLMGTEEIFVMHHTQCGVEGRTNQDVVDMIQENLGEDASSLDFLTCKCARASVSEDVDTLKECKLINPGTKVTGLLYHVETGEVEHVC